MLIARRPLRRDLKRLAVGPGEVAEWSIAPHSKCGVRASVPGVRIPPSPPICHVNANHINELINSPRVGPTMGPILDGWCITVCVFAVFASARRSISGCHVEAARLAPIQDLRARRPDSLCQRPRQRDGRRGRLLALMFAVKWRGAVEQPRGGRPSARKALAAQSWERSERRRLIKLLSAGWLPPSVSSSRGFPRSRGRASGASPAT